MKVTKAQAQENRERIVDTAAALFKEHGYEGVGVANLMAAAGFTHGGFYKHFKSKADLIVETTVQGAAQNLASNAGLSLEGFVKQYLSRAHRNGRSAGCTLAALSGDSARQTEDVKAQFAQAIENRLSVLQRKSMTVNYDETHLAEARLKMMNTFAHMVGALVLSRACPDDSKFADEILRVCRRQILASLRDDEPTKRPA